jgi:glycosyltransferase involved in cell wall biosynthesis
LAVLEAALAGCALVLGDIPSLREIWRGAALYVSPTDPAAIQQALQSLIVAPERRRSLGQAARQRARRFSPARMARGYMKLYNKLASGRYPSRKKSQFTSGRVVNSDLPQRKSAS